MIAVIDDGNATAVGATVMTTCVLSTSWVSGSIAVMVTVALPGRLKEWKNSVAWPATTSTGPWPMIVVNSLMSGVVGLSSVEKPPYVTGFTLTLIFAPLTSWPFARRQVTSISVR